MHKPCKKDTIKPSKNARIGYVNKFRAIKEDSNEQMLWRAVLCQAVEDANCKSHKIDKKSIGLKAKTWLMNDNEDFKIVCDMAGYDPARVRRHIKNIIN